MARKKKASSGSNRKILCCGKIQDLSDPVEESLEGPLRAPIRELALFSQYRGAPVHESTIQELFGKNQEDPSKRYAFGAVLVSQQDTNTGHIACTWYGCCPTSGEPGGFPFVIVPDEDIKIVAREGVLVFSGDKRSFGDCEVHPGDQYLAQFFERMS